MCHHYDFDTDRTYDRADADDEEDDLPSFAKEESADDVEVLTDGGDDE